MQDTRVVTATATAAGAEAKLINYGPYTWDVQQVSPTADAAPIGSTGKLYKIGKAGTAFVCDFIPQSDAVTGSPTISLYPGESCAARWTGLPAGTAVGATFIYDDGQRS